jgi:penicillin-binding protein 2
MQIGNTLFHNWKKTGAGSLNFAEAFEQSCDTWFYQVGIKTGAQPILDWATKLGLGAKTGLALASEAEGRVPSQEYMKKVYGRKYLGQGDLLVTPLQLAEAMGAIANGGTVYQSRLVQQVQSAEGQVVANYSPRVRDSVEMNPDFYKALKKAMVQVVEGGNGTAHQAEVPGVSVAGKTGTAQWGPKKNERTAAWFAGFIPADKPKYAFAAVYEGEPGKTGIHGGTYAAPMIGKIMGELFKDPKGKKSKAAPAKKPEAESTD